MTRPPTDLATRLDEIDSLLLHAQLLGTRYRYLHRTLDHLRPDELVERRALNSLFRSLHHLTLQFDEVTR